jgi:hypothetical protein
MQSGADATPPQIVDVIVTIIDPQQREGSFGTARSLNHGYSRCSARNGIGLTTRSKGRGDA